MEQTSERSDDVSPYRRRLSASNGQLYACAREKFPRTFAHRVGSFILIVLSSHVCIGVLVCECIDVGPSNATERAWISAARATVEAPI